MVETPKPRQAVFFLNEGSGNFVNGSLPLDGNGECLVGRRKEIGEAGRNSELASQALMEILRKTKAKSPIEIEERMGGINEALEGCRLASGRYLDLLAKEARSLRERTEDIARDLGIMNG